MIEKITMKHIEVRSEAYKLLAEILASDLPEEVLCEFLGQLRNHPVSETLLSGFRDAIMERAIKVDLGTNDTVDICGTGGDGKNTFNISTLAALTVASCGMRVVKHGNSAFSSSVGSSDILQRIGIPMPKTPDEARKQFEQCGVAFLHAPYFHPSLKQIGTARKKVRFRTIFNLLGPLCNPANPGTRILGVSQYEVFRVYRAFLSRINTRYAVLWDEGGYDEISLTGRGFISVNGRDTIIAPSEIIPEKISPSLLAGGNSPEENEALFLHIASGKADEEKLSAVAVNAGIALYVSGKASSLKNGFEMAKESLKSGKVLEKINRLKSI